MAKETGKAETPAPPSPTDLVKVKVLHLDFPDGNPGQGRKGYPIQVGVNGNVQAYDPGVEVVMTRVEAEVLEQTGRYSVTYIN